MKGRERFPDTPNGLRFQEIYLRAQAEGKEKLCLTGEQKEWRIRESDSFYINITDTTLLLTKCLYPLYRKGHTELADRLHTLLLEMAASSDALEIYQVYNFIIAQQIQGEDWKLPFKVDFRDIIPILLENTGKCKEQLKGRKESGLNFWKNIWRICNSSRLLSRYMASEKQPTEVEIRKIPYAKTHDSYQELYLEMQEKGQEKLCLMGMEEPYRFCWSLTHQRKFTDPECLFWRCIWTLYLDGHAEVRSRVQQVLQEMAESGNVLEMYQVYRFIVDLQTCAYTTTGIPFLVDFTDIIPPLLEKTKECEEEMRKTTVEGKNVWEEVQEMCDCSKQIREYLAKQ